MNKATITVRMKADLSALRTSDHFPREVSQITKRIRREEQEVEGWILDYSVDAHRELLLGYDRLGRIVRRHCLEVSNVWVASGNYYGGDQEIEYRRAKMAVEAMRAYALERVLVEETPFIENWKLAKAKGRCKCSTCRCPRVEYVDLDTPRLEGWLP